MSPKNDRFIFRRSLNIGAVDALEDSLFLQNCFVDTGLLTALKEHVCPEALILGRTGSGKTALLTMLHSEAERSIRISPEDLALVYLSNNEALKFFIEAGVDMDLFFRYLWKHILVVEVIKDHFGINTEIKVESFMQKIKNKVFKSRSREMARNYLIEWGSNFWKETDFKIKEITNKVENELKAGLSASTNAGIKDFMSSGIELSASTAQRLSEEQKSEVVRLGQAVVNNTQMREMNEVLRALGDDLLDDNQKKYYITIDRLDERWVQAHLKYRLIRALIDVARDLNSELDNVKIIISLREDLMRTVLSRTSKQGDQEEKYKSLFLEVRWNSADLEKILDSRVSQLIKSKYTKRVVTLRDILPEKIKNTDPVNYMISKTLSTPRDVIMFFNECIKAADGKPSIAEDDILSAESIFSQERYNSILSEWSDIYPGLDMFIRLLRRKKSVFRISDLSNLDVDNWLLEYLDKYKSDDEIANILEREMYEKGNREALSVVFEALFDAGVVGIRRTGAEKVIWSFEGGTISVNLLKQNEIFIHPAFWMFLEIDSI